MRTPFVKAFAEYLELDTIALAGIAARGLLEKFPIPRNEIDSIIWGGVILPGMAPNVGREVALDLELPASVEAMTVTRACASGLQAVTLGAAAIERGEADVVIVGGSDSTSNAEIKLPQKVVHAAAPLVFGKKATPGDILGVIGKMFPLSEVLPKIPKIAERTTGQCDGERRRTWRPQRDLPEAQDAFALASQPPGRRRESPRVASPRDRPRRGARQVGPHTDTMVRADTSLEKLAKLRPVFAKDGSLTAGNSSPLTDGAAAVLLMSEEKARALGLTALARFASWAYVGVDPADQLLMGPALAMPKALERAGLSLDQIDLVDMHEAFAAQSSPCSICSVVPSPAASAVTSRGPRGSRELT